MLKDAIRIAAIKHGQAHDKGGQPFIGHPLRVMAAVAARLGTNVPEHVLEAAVLHDVIEDTATDYRELRASGISEDAIALVEMLTRSDTMGYFDYIARIAEHGGYAVDIKLCDLADNLNPARRIEGMKLPERYERAVAMLWKR